VRPKSKKRAALDRVVNPQRKAYVQEQGMCDVCRVTEEGPFSLSECHEILRGRFRDEALRHRTCWLAVCRHHHRELDDASKWPVPKQFAAKLLVDPENFDLPTIQGISDDTRKDTRTTHAIEWADIVSFLTLREAT
jgi:hypothetical protein